MRCSRKKRFYNRLIYNTHTQHIYMHIQLYYITYILLHNDGYENVWARVVEKEHTKSNNIRNYYSILILKKSNPMIFC